jgi:Stage II sporulation protein E (SpoIIE)
MRVAVRYAIARPAGGWRRFAGSFCIALAALAAAAPPARAALPNLTDQVNDVTNQVTHVTDQVKLPVKDGAVGDLVPDGNVKGVVDDVVNAPLPDPVENVVESSPVAPVRDEVRRVVSGTGGGGSGGGGGGSGGGTTGGTGGGSGGTGGGSGPPTGGSGDGDHGGRNGAGGRHGAGRADVRRGRGTRGAGTARRGAAGITPGRAGSGPASARGRSGDARGHRGGADGAESAPRAAIRTIEKVVEAIPTAIWIALGVLSLLALVLAGRTWVERRNARALARDRDRLRDDVAALERALLPAVPERLGATCVSVAYRSCDGPAAGGDFYDAFELPGGRAAVIVGDVAGHGPDALEGTNSVRAQLHALLETGMSPRTAIAAVGERAPIQLAGRFSTVVVAVHDPADGTLTFATAGHAPPVVVGPGAEELMSAGASPPIGVGLRTGLRETRIALPPGFTCCFYTDGLVEAKNGDGMIGRARFAEMVAELGPDDEADVLLERVIAEATDASDDMTVCLLRPLAGVEERSPRVEILEVDAEEVESGFAARFLDACGVAEAEIAIAVEQARPEIATAGLALLEVRLEDGVAHARVIAAPAAAAPPAAAV